MSENGYIEVTLDNAMVIWNPNQRVRVVAHPDTIGESDTFLGSVGACYSEYRDLSTLYKLDYLKLFYDNLINEEGITEAQANAAFGVIPEWAEYIETESKKPKPVEIIEANCKTAFEEELNKVYGSDYLFQNVFATSNGVETTFYAVKALKKEKYTELMEIYEAERKAFVVLSENRIPDDTNY